MALLCMFDGCDWIQLFNCQIDQNIDLIGSTTEHSAIEVIVIIDDRFELFCKF